MKTFEKFVLNIHKNQDIKENINISNYLNEKSFNKNNFEELLEADLKDFLSKNNIITEGLDFGALLKKGKEKIFEWFFSIIKSIMNKVIDAKDQLIKISKKLIQTLKSVGEKIIKWMKKNPKTVKVLIVIIVLLLIMILSASSATASNDPALQQQFVEHANVAISFLDKLQAEGDTHAHLGNLMEAKAYFIELRNSYMNGGEAIDISQLSETTQAVINATTETVNGMDKDSKYYEYAIKGFDFLDTSWTKITSSNASFTELKIFYK